MSGQPTRRALLGAAAALPVLSVSCAPQPAAAVPAATDVRFMRLYRAWEKANAINERYCSEVWEPAHDRFEAAVAAIPHENCPHSFVNFKGEVHRFTTDGNAARMARQVLRDEGEPAPGPADSDFIRDCRWLVDADDRRNFQIEALKVSTGYDAATDREQTLGDRRYALEWAAIECPVTTLAALALKCKLVRRHPDCEPETYLIADILRMAGETPA